MPRFPLRLLRLPNVPESARRGAIPLFCLACAATLLSWALHQAEWRWSRALDNIAIDMGFRLRGETDVAQIARKPETQKILIVELQHSLPRTVLASLVDQLHLARVVALDLMLTNRAAELSDDEKQLPAYRSEMKRWEQENARLATSLRRANNVVLGAWPERVVTRASGNPPENRADVEWLKPPDVVWNAARWHAHLRVEPDPGDGIVRRLRLSQPVTFGHQGVLPAFAAAASGSTVEFDRTSNGEVVINYLGGRRCFEDDSNRIIASRVLNDCTPEDFRGLTVFVGETAYSSKDVFPTPYGDLPGVQIQAHAAATLAAAGGPPREVGPLLTLITALGASLLLMVPLARLPLWSATLAAAGLAGALALGAAAIFAWGHRVLPLGMPIFAVLFSYNAVALWEYRRARTTLGRFIGADMVAGAMRPLDALRLGGRTENATAFFCDLRGYSALSEQLTPERAATLLNAYTSTLVSVVRRWGGRPIDYLGDGVFVLFESSRTGGKHALHAAQAGLDVKEELVRLAETLERETHGDEVSVRDALAKAAIAIHTGEMSIGMVGDENNLKLGAVGDAVNVAARVQGFSSVCGFDVLATREACAGFGEEAPFTLVPCGQFAVKGRQSLVEIFGVASRERKSPTH